MIFQTQEEVEETIANLENEQIPKAEEKYLKLQNQMVDRQGFVSIQLQNQVEMAKNEYFVLKDKLDELKNLLSYLNLE